MSAMLRWPALCAALLVSHAQALCPPPGLPPPTRYVGDVAHDANCTDDNIQSAIDHATCPNTFIVITREHTYTQQHLSIADKSLMFTATGDGVFCNDGGGSTGGGGSVITAPLVTIAGNGNQSVFDISGTSNVTFQYLEITGGGGDADSHGGGIDFNGAGSLTIDTSTIDSNHAGFGGGIEMRGSGDALLTLKNYSVIESNTASGNGGGINIEGFTQLLALQPFTLIGFNHAPNGTGGGIAVVAPARADIGSPGYSALPVINGNDAALGGGLSAQATTLESFPATINLFTTDPQNPVTVSGNFASQRGGAIYLKPFFDELVTTADLCAADFRIDGNSAPEGSAIFADENSDLASRVFVNNSGRCGPSPGAVPCARGVVCNTINDNNAVDGANHRQPGAVILAAKSIEIGAFLMDRVAFRHNTGAHAIRVQDTRAVISNCLIADNDFSAETLLIENQGEGGTSVDISNCTIANNTHNSGSIIHTGIDLGLRYMILDQPAMSSVSTSGAPAIVADDILAADPTGLPLQANIVQGEPLYVNAAAEDYHLRTVVQGGVVTASAGIDFAPPIKGDDRDLDDNPHDQDVPLVVDAFGVRDLGAYEAQPILDRIFADGLGDPISLLQ